MGNCFIKKIQLITSYSSSQTYTQFNYTGGVQTYTVPTNGWYKLECWGSNGARRGGGGGYSRGYKQLKKGTVIYVVCGGQPYNGGGYGAKLTTTGGGATHMAYVSGTLSSIGYTSFVTNGNGLIVAGGSGGGGEESSYATGGSGGGTSGGNGMDRSRGYGASQTGPGGGRTSGSFGQGGSAVDWGGAGGGGFYGGGGGGGSGYDGADGSGGGGSGWIGGVDNYGDLTKTTSNGGNGGNGYARITPMFEVIGYLRRPLIAK